MNATGQATTAGGLRRSPPGRRSTTTARPRARWLARSATIAIGTGYGLGLLVYSLVRPRAASPVGLLELANSFAPWWFAPVPAIVLAGLALRSTILTLAALVAAITFTLTWWDRFVPPVSPPAQPVSILTVMTLNVLALNPEHDDLAAAIGIEDPDVVALQELEPDAAADLAQALDERYPYRALQTETKRGAGVLSRYPLGDVEAFRLSEGGNWSQRMVVDAPIGGVTLFNVHPAVPRLVWSERGLGPLRLLIGYDTERRSAEVGRLTELVDTVRGPLLVMGDFNMTEYSRDYRRVAERLADAYPAVTPGFGHTFPRLGSFPSALPAPWPVVRLDYVWHSAELRPLSAHVGPSGKSDHHPVVVRLAPAASFRPS